MMKPITIRQGCRHGIRALPVVIGFAAAFAATGPITARAASDAAATSGTYAADHREATGSLADIGAAIAAIVGAENATTSGPAPYKVAAQSAINALVGSQDQAFDPHVANPGDAAGAIGHVNRLLDRESDPPWVPALHGVLVNTEAAVDQLQSASAADGLDNYQLAASQALADLEMASGRADEYDALGGMSGALANTDLGVTESASVENGCAAPDRAGFGTYGGYLAYRAVPLAAVSSRGIDNPGGPTVGRHGGMLVFYTAAAPLVRQLCASHAEAAAMPSVRDATLRSGGFAPLRSPLLIEAAATSGPPPALYTTQQAQAGASVYAQSCASCHGGTLQGVAGPAIGGTDFLQTATKNNWTVSVLRTIVTQNMPLNNPASLTDTQYAQVMAYLLASNCYPAGNAPFPTQDTPALGKVTLGPLDHPSGTPDKNGVCPVH